MAHKSLADYTHLAGRELVEEVRALAEPLKGLRVSHISATAFGGGVSELLYTLVPLMRDVGLDADWQVIYGRDEFFHATKQMHNALQGDPQDLTEEQWAVWLGYNELNAQQLHDELDLCFVHDPQPAALMGLAREKSRHWLWRCHIDLSTPNPATIERLLPYVRDYPHSVFHLADYVPAGMDGQVHIVPPAIDPLAPKNMALSPEDAAYVCQQFGVDVDRPLLLQVSRFDPWKDPIGVIDAYRAVKEEIPDVQLALVGSMAQRRPGGLGVLQRDAHPRRRRRGHQDPQQLQRRRQHRGQRLPGARGRRHPEVDARGLRPDGHRGALEGQGVRRRATSAASRCRSRTARPASS